MYKNQQTGRDVRRRREGRGGERRGEGKANKGKATRKKDTKYKMYIIYINKEIINFKINV